MKMRLGLFFALLLLIGCVTTAGAYATWKYAEYEVPNKYFSVDMGVSEEGFYYPPEVVVPDNDNNSVKENHLELINIILHEASYGLNATKKPIIHEYLDENGNVIYCNQNVQGGNLKHILTKQTNAENVQFCITRISEAEYHTYTFSQNLLNATAYGNQIEVYKTVMVKDEDGVWSAPKSFKGVALVFDPGIVSRSIDISTWVRSLT